MSVRSLHGWLAAGAVLFSTTACSVEPAPSAAPAAGADDAIVTLSRLLAEGDVAKDYLRRAKEADRLTDPLARCLAFPDFPGNQWPKGLAAAHCELNFGKRVQVDDIQQALDRNELKLLDARFAADLARHFSESDFSEAIHGDFDAFDGLARSDVLSKAWVEKAPESAFAQAARGEHFRRAENILRAGRFVSDISNEEFKQLAILATQALEHFERALRLEPRLIEAYVGMINAARVDSRDGVVQDAIQRGRALDPACALLADQTMVTLTPQWGGSYEQMDAYGKELASHLARRPLLATKIEWPKVHLAESLRDDDKATAARFAAEAARVSTEPAAFINLAVARREEPTAHTLEAAAYAVAASRFKPADVGNAGVRGELLLTRAHDPQWALSALEFAERRGTKDGAVHFYLGDTYRALQRPEDARRQYTLAMADEDSRGGAMQRLAEMVTADAPKDIDPAKAIGPEEAIRLAIDAAPVGVPGTFTFTVQATGLIRGSVYLNSYPDYRDPQNVTIEIYPEAAAALREKSGPDLEAALKGKTVIVTGVVRRVPIFVGGPPKPTTPLYHQTHVKVHDAVQLRVVPASGH